MYTNQMRISEIDLKHCQKRDANYNISFPTSQYLIEEGGRAVNIQVGRYDSERLMVGEICMEMKAEGTSYTMQNFTSRGQRLGRGWNIFDQYNCFEESLHSVRYLSVSTSCRNLTLTWLNRKFDEYWFIRGQSVSIIEASALNRTIAYQVVKLRTENSYEYRGLAPNTEYRVCVITDYGVHGKKAKCRNAFTRCKEFGDKMVNEKTPVLKIWLKPTLIISGLIVGILICFFLAFYFINKQRMRISESGRNEAPITCRAGERVKNSSFTDEEDLIRPMERTHEYFEIVT